MDKAASRIRLRNNCSKTRNPLKSVPYGNFLADSFFILDFFLYLWPDYKHSDCRYRRRALLRPQEGYVLVITCQVSVIANMKLWTKILRLVY